MSRDKVSIAENVMAKIRSGDVKMHSRWYFILGSAALLAGVVASMIMAVFFVSLTAFALRTHGPGGSYRLQEILLSFPWWTPILALAGIGLGIWLLKKYDISYKHNFIAIVVGLLFAIIITGALIDYLGLNDVWMRRGPMREYWQQFGGQGTGGRQWRHGQGSQ